MTAHMRDPGLLARDAEGLFWMARYLERVENLARLHRRDAELRKPRLRDRVPGGRLHPHQRR